MFSFKKSILPLGILASQFLAQSFADDSKGIYLSVGAGISKLKDLELLDHSDGDVYLYEIDVNNGFLYSAGVGYDFGKIRAELNYRKDYLDYNELEYSDGIMSFPGDLSAHTTAVNLFYDFHNDSKMSPYISIGVGSTNIQTKVDECEIGAGNTSSGNNTSYNIKVGTSYAFNKKSDLFIEAIYLTLQDVKLFDHVGGGSSVDVNSYAFQSGVRFTF